MNFSLGLIECNFYIFFIEQISESLGLVAGASMGWGLQKLAGPPLAFGIGSGILVIGMFVIVCFVKEYQRPRISGNYDLPTFDNILAAPI